jgi:hypothetical protein
MLLRSISASSAIVRRDRTNGATHGSKFAALFPPDPHEEIQERSSFAKEIDTIVR